MKKDCASGRGNHMGKGSKKGRAWQGKGSERAYQMCGMERAEDCITLLTWTSMQMVMANH